VSTAAGEPEVLCLGEALVDLYARPAGATFATAESFVRHPGGAPANVATAIARLGGKTRLCTRVGDDDLGRFLCEALAAEGVDVAGVTATPEASTGLCFLVSQGDQRRFLRYPRGAPAADKRMLPTDLDGEPLDRAQVVVAGSTGLAREPSRSTWTLALHQASRAGRLLVDVNLRLHQWEDPELAIRLCRQMVGLAQVVKASHDELEPLLGAEDAGWPDDPQRAARALRGLGPEVALVTLGERGAWVEGPGLSVQLPAPVVPVVDVTGAGDGFVGVVALALARLQRFTASPSIAAALAGAPAGWWEAVAALANQVGALATTAVGATPALPSLGELSSRGASVWPLLGLNR
jgi:sugar/nucleoside kinase (ribokinase family)